MIKLKLTKEEQKLIARCSTPEKMQKFLDSIPYNYKDTFWSFRKVARNKAANCFEGALAAAFVLSQHGYKPLIVCMEAKEDLDHNIFVYRKNGKWGSVAISRDEGLKGRKPIFKSMRALIMSYYPYYYSAYTKDRNDLTLRGFSDVIDMRQFKEDWATSGRNLLFLERYLYKIQYRKLFPRRKGLYKGLPAAKKKNYYYSPLELDV